MRKLAIFPFTLILLADFSQAQAMDPSMMGHSRMDHATHTAPMADARRQAEISERGQDVMPFKLTATTHIFTKNTEGGVQRVVAKKTSDQTQAKLVRKHLQEIRGQFLQGDFSGPGHIHGQGMPGLAELKAADPGQIGIMYRDVQGGAELTYKTADARLVVALHKWFDAQLSDHGNDAKEGYAHHGGVMKQ